MDLDVSIRLATASDAERVANLLDVFRREAGLTAQTAVPLPVDQGGPQYVLLAQVGDQHPVAVACLQRCHNLVRGMMFLLLTDVYVLEEYRRHGVATALLNEAIALGRRVGCCAFSMIAREDDQATLATAARTGFFKHPDLLLELNLDC